MTEQSKPFQIASNLHIDKVARDRADAGARSCSIAAFNWGDRAAFFSPRLADAIPLRLSS